MAAKTRGVKKGKDRTSMRTAKNPNGIVLIDREYIAARAKVLKYADGCGQFVANRPQGQSGGV